MPPSEWHRQLYAAGWLGLSWPEEYGGRGLPEVYESILNDEIAACGAPPKPYVVGYLGRALLLFGSEEQKHRFLPGLLSGEERWCEGFSEPEAGSDLAALRTKATPSDGGWVIDGQKVWTSDAASADWCLVLARSDPDSSRYHGISAFAVDMKSAGVTIRPIVQITGRQDFCEVFYDGVRVPADRMIGQPGSGWTLAMTTLSYERGPGDIGFVAAYSRTLQRLEARAQTRSHPADDLTATRLARCYVDIEALKIHVWRSLAARADGVPPGPESSVAKILMTRAEQGLEHLAMDIAGAPALVGVDADTATDYLSSRAQSIMGGTEQIQKNIIAQRVLGLPR